MFTQTSVNFDELLNALNRGTDNRKLRWRETATEGTFRAAFSKGQVRIAQDPVAGLYVLTLVDQDGTILEEVRPSGEGTQIALEGLYRKARQQALCLDERLKAFVEHLKSLAD